MRTFVYDYIKKKYKISPDYPWEKYDHNAVFRHVDNRKWFGLVMRVRRNRLGLSGEDDVDVINLKIDDMFFRDMLVSRDGIMPAYHMNKQHWITVLLDGTVEGEDIFSLIDMSFMATASVKKKRDMAGEKQ